MHKHYVLVFFSCYGNVHIRMHVFNNVCCQMIATLNVVNSHSKASYVVAVNVYRIIIISKRAVSFQCLFCAFFGHEENVSSKQKHI